MLVQARPGAAPRTTRTRAPGSPCTSRTAGSTCRTPSKKYNLILFALPDSLTALAGQSSLRLESYLLTEQSIAAARAHLAPGGTFAMYNYYAPFLFNRYATTIEQAFGQAPCVEVGPPLGGRRLAVLTDKRPGRRCRTASQRLARRPGRPGHRRPPVPVPAEQHHPEHLPVDAGADPARLGACWSGSSAASLPRMSGYLDLAFMGAAFLLLETKNIVQFALLFGSTWFVNSLVFAGVLVPCTWRSRPPARLPLPQPWCCTLLLIASLVLTWVVPQEIAARAADGGAVLRGRGAGVRAGLPGQPDLRAAVQRRGHVRRRVRREPARGDGRRRAGVPGPDHRLPVPADPGRVLYGAAFITSRTRLAALPGR